MLRLQNLLNFDGVQNLTILIYELNLTKSLNLKIPLSLRCDGKRKKRRE